MKKIASQKPKPHSKIQSIAHKTTFFSPKTQHTLETILLHPLCLKNTSDHDHGEHEQVILKTIHIYRSAFPDTPIHIIIPQKSMISLHHLDDHIKIHKTSTQYDLIDHLFFGLQQLSLTHVRALVAPLIQPDLNISTLHLLDQITKTNTTHITQPVHQGQYGHPLIIPSHIHQNFPTLHILGNDHLETLFHHHNIAVHRVEIDDPGILSSLTPPLWQPGTHFTR